MSETSYRPEQNRALKIFRGFFDKKCIWAEYELNDLTIDGEPTANSIIDIAIISGENKLAIRLNGGYHFASDKQIRKDEWQKIAIEQAGWRVIDFNEEDMPILWKNDVVSKDMMDEVMGML